MGVNKTHAIEETCKRLWAGLKEFPGIHEIWAADPAEGKETEW
jgi:hypothetical protein